MLDLSKDERYKALVSQLEQCADKFCLSEEMRRNVKSDDDFKKSVVCFDDASYMRDTFLKGMSDYINSFSDIDDRKQIAGSFLFKVLNSYNSKDNRKKRRFFADDGRYIESKIIENCPLTDIDKKRYLAHITKSRKNNKISQKALNILYSKEGKEVIRDKNPLEDKDINVVIPTADLLKSYTSYLCKYASNNNNENVSVVNILILLRRNAEYKGLCDVNSTLFSEGYKKETVDKKMVLEVAKLFAQNIDVGAVVCEENNKQFDANMCKMLGYIVTKYGYKKKDVEELNKVLIENSSDKKYAESLTKSIDYAYNQLRQSTIHKKR